MISNFLNDDDERQPEPEPEPESGGSIKRHGQNSGMLGLFDADDEPGKTETYTVSQPEPMSTAESGRQMGLAYSAGVVFVGAVGFMLILGWGADLLLGSKPWGIVVGIVLGSIIGFIQFFRITSQIFKK